MKDIPMKRILRLYLAAFIVLFFVAWSNPANAETGNITVTDDRSYSYGMGGIDNSGTSVFTAWAYVVFDSVNYTKLNDIKVENSSTVTITLTNDFESTRFSCNTGCTGGGWFYYTKGNPNTVKYVWDSSSTFPSSTSHTVMLLDFVNIKVSQNITVIDSALSNTGASTNSTRPACVKRDNPEDCTNYTYTTSASTTTTNSYNVTYGEAGLFFVNVTKGTIPTMWSILDVNFNAYVTESTFNTVSKQFANDSYNGIRANVSIATGAFTLATINLTGTSGEPPAPPTVDPVTGVGIQFDAASYSIGGTANISWIRNSPTPFGYQDDIYLIQPTTTGSTVKKILVASPPDSGYVKTNDFPIAGGYNVSFERSVFGLFPEILASDTATVISESASYILVNATVPVGVYTDGTYFYGWNGTGRIVIYQDMSDGTVKEIDSLAINTTCCVEHTVSQLFFPEPGNYRVVLMKGYSDVKAVASVVAYLSDIVPGANITVSNISLDKSQYTYGEPYTISYQVDSFNYSNKAKRIIAYEVATGANTLINQVPAQTGSITRTFDSEMFPFSGALQFRLMGLNATGDYLLASVNFTLSKIDTEGYGLDVTKSPICIKETGYFTYYSPSPVTVSISDRDFTVYSKNLTSAISGKTVPFTINRAGNYEIFLRPNNSNDVKFTKIIEVKACNISAQSPVSGAGQAQQVAAAITTPIFWALIVTAGLMIAIAWKTRDGFAAGSIGMLSAGVFAFMSWLPLWIFFSALIIAALLISSSIVSKQLKKTG